MENLTASAQSDRHLDFLLEYLACPIDNSVRLTPVRDHDGAVIALKSDDREYPVIDRVPCLIPDPGGARDASHTLWQKLQNAAWREYQSGHEGVFSAEDDPMGCSVGRIIGQSEAGLFLDVGCGPLPLPAYMASSKSTITWIGVDPFFGDAARRYPFVQGLGEYLPFRRQVFDGVLFAGVIDHVIDPLQALQRARGIIKPRGKLFIWYGLRHVDLRYIVWKIMRRLGLAWRYNENHQWAFTHRTLRAFLKSAGFAIEEVISLCDNYCPDYATCCERLEFLAIARCI
jgi:SAM-dependent methyltransferase